MKSIKHMRARLIFFGVAAVATTIVATSSIAAAHDDQPRELRDVRHATAKFKDLKVATDGGYGILKDLQGIACIDNPGVGAMGVHYVNGTLVGSGVIDALKPQALVYEPTKDGRHQHLVALEYVAFQDAWDASHTGPPELFGQQFMLTPAGNRFGLPAFYSLHAWIFKSNPTGTFSMWNPRVHCPSGHVHHDDMSMDMGDE